MARKRRTWEYAGVLAEPMVSKSPMTPPGADPESPPREWLERGGSMLWSLLGEQGPLPESWRTTEFTEGVWREAVLGSRREDTRAFCQGLTAWHARVCALYEHFDIDQSEPHAAWDLAFSLVLRHEPEFVNVRGRASISALWQRYQVDPDAAGAAFSLAMHLAESHVPGFHTAIPKPPGRHQLGPMLALLSAMATVREDIRQTGRVPQGREAHEISRTLRDERLLRKVLTSEAARAVGNALLAMGNKEKGTLQRALSDKTLRDYHAYIKTAWPRYLAGKANTFQMQLLFGVVPLVDRAVSGELRPQKDPPPPRGAPSSSRGPRTSSKRASASSGASPAEVTRRKRS